VYRSGKQKHGSSWYTWQTKQLLATETNWSAHIMCTVMSTNLLLWCKHMAQEALRFLSKFHSPCLMLCDTNSQRPPLIQVRSQQSAVSSQLPNTDDCSVTVLRKLRSVKLLIAQNICNTQIPICTQTSSPMIHERELWGSDWRRATCVVIHERKVLGFISRA
jgi:hypothetical protein